MEDVLIVNAKIINALKLFYIFGVCILSHTPICKFFQFINTFYFLLVYNSSSLHIALSAVDWVFLLF